MEKQLFLAHQQIGSRKWDSFNLQLTNGVDILLHLPGGITERSSA